MAFCHYYVLYIIFLVAYFSHTCMLESQRICALLSLGVCTRVTVVFHWKRFVLHVWHHLLTTAAFTTLSDVFSMDRMNNRDSDGFFSRLVCRSSDSSYNSTDSSLTTANSTMFLAFLLECIYVYWWWAGTVFISGCCSRGGLVLKF